MRYGVTQWDVEKDNDHWGGSGVRRYVPNRDQGKFGLVADVLTKVYLDN